MIQTRRSVLPTLCACALLVAGCDDPLTPDLWEEGAWRALGDGVIGEVYAFAELDGQLYAAGELWAAGDQPARNVARWDGQRWHPVGTGLGGSVWSLAVFRGELIAAGRIAPAGETEGSGVARWDGSDWHRMGDNLVGWPAHALVAHGDDLYVSAEAVTAAGDTVPGLARWDGASWIPVRVPLDGEENQAHAPAVVHDGDLIVTIREGVTTPFPARWNGATWSRMDAPAEPVQRLVAGDGELYGLGWSGFLARWTGDSWQDVEPGLPSGQQAAALMHEGALVIGGHFPDSPAPGASFTTIQRLTGTGWHAIDGGMDGRVTALGSYGRSLVAAGIDGTPFRGIAVFDAEGPR